jgi:hypothetical protein
MVFHGFAKARTPKRKDHAQDGWTLIAKFSRSQRPAILPWSFGFESRQSFRYYGQLARYTQPPDCDWTLVRMICLRKTGGHFGCDHASADNTTSARKNAREMRA